jgi:sporulation protein YlmC with PRC-barrel domain
VADETEFAMGAEASCADGPGGKVTRVIIDPATGTVTHLVIEPKNWLGATGRLVPLDLVEAATADGIRLRCTVAEFGGLEAAEETEVVDGLAGGMALGGFGPPLGVAAPVQVVVEDVVPLGEADVSRGEPVHAVDGEIGRVEGVRVDPVDHRVTHVLLQEGHLWDRKDVAIPIRAVTGVADGIRLSLSKQQVQDLPPVDIQHPGG